MFKFKQEKGDFVVVEVGQHNILKSGKFGLYYLVKEDYTTEKAISTLSKMFHIPINHFGFAGNKDKKAFTFQYLTIKNGNERFSYDSPQLKLVFLGYLDEPISIGKLEGNKFYIKVYSDNKPRTLDFIPNYFDTQRFSEHNVEIGEALIKKDFKKARDLIFSANHISLDKSNDFVNEITSSVSKFVLLLYVHSFQSMLYNLALSQYIKEKTKEFREVNISHQKLFFVDEKIDDLKLPLLGFDSDFANKEIEEIYIKVMHDFDVNLKDFVIRQIPWLSLEGSERDAFVKIKNLKISQVNYEEWFLEFALPKGSYATIVLKSLFH